MNTNSTLLEAHHVFVPGIWTCLVTTTSINWIDSHDLRKKSDKLSLHRKAVLQKALWNKSVLPQSLQINTFHKSKWKRICSSDIKCYFTLKNICKSLKQCIRGLKPTTFCKFKKVTLPQESVLRHLILIHLYA